MWNVILNSLNDHKVVPPTNNPSKDGQYLCTCIIKCPNSNEYYRYLRVVEYKKDKNQWHDIGNKSGISHVILAWKEQEVCDFNDFKYESGMLFEK